MAVSSLPARGVVAGLSSSSSSCVLNSRAGKCYVCQVRMGSVSPAVVAARYETDLSSRDLALWSSPMNRSPMLASASGRSFCYQKGRLSIKTSSHGQELSRGETVVKWNHQRGVRLKVSANKDSGRDVALRTDSSSDAEVSYRRLPTPSTEEGEEQNEPETESEENVSEHLRTLDTESDSASVSDGVNSANKKEKDGGGMGNSAAIGTAVASLGLIVAFSGFGALGFIYKDQINDFLNQFSDFLEGYGPAGYGLFVVVYAGLEMLAIPAIPLTMSAGLLFGALQGTILVSIAGTIAATGAFLVARYLARNRLLDMAKGNKKFLAIDKAIGADGFRVVALLRLSPLLPLSLSNYLYGLTSVELGPYILGSWVGMLPGTWAYVSAGAIGRSFITKEESEPFFTGSPEQLWTLGLGLAVTVFAATYVTRVAKEALKDIDD